MADALRNYHDLHARSVEAPEEFWGAQAARIDWVTPPTVVLDASSPPMYRWFPDASLNTCFNAVDRHVLAGRGDTAAIIHDSAYSGEVTRTTYAELLDQVARFAGGLRELGVGVGDRVVVYMPMVSEALVAMLACARIGAIHSVVFGGFAAHELAKRLDDAKPKVVVAASCGIEPKRILAYQPLVEEAIRTADHTPEAVVVLQRPELAADLSHELAHDWAELVAGAEPAECVTVAATDPLYILYTSGTTGNPRGVVRDNGGHAVALAWTMEHVYDVHAGDVWWAASDVGWVVGHSYIVYAPLLVGATTVLFEGKPIGTPDAGAFWRVVEQHGVSGLFTAPTAIRAIRRDDPEGDLIGSHDVSSLHALFLAGERLDPDTYDWADEHLRVPVIDNWWQTETGWPICASVRIGDGWLERKAGSPSVPMPGYDVRILDESGDDVPTGHDGSIAVRLPLPPGTLPTLWQNDERYVSDYLSRFPGYYLTGDGGYRDEDGYVFVMGRTDDVINVAGHRFSTGMIEAALATHPAVAECAVIGVADSLKGQIPRGLVVVKAGAEAEPTALGRELVELVRSEIGAVASLNQVDVVPALPKTRSGKVLRRTMRDIADGGEGVPPSTIENPAVLDALRPVLRGELG